MKAKKKTATGSVASAAAPEPRSSAPEALAREEATERDLDEALDESFPASDPISSLRAD
jgi:hypothetical protein